MTKLIRAKCAYVTGKGSTKGGFHFSMVAEYHENDSAPTYKKYNIIFYPTRDDLKAENLNIDFEKLVKNRKESFIFSKNPYSTEQMKAILPNIRRIAANFEELEQCVNRKTGIKKETRHLKDDESGQYFAKEMRFIEQIDFIAFHDAYKDREIILVDKGVSKF